MYSSYNRTKTQFIVYFASCRNILGKVHKRYLYIFDNLIWLFPKGVSVRFSDGQSTV